MSKPKSRVYKVLLLRRAQVDSSCEVEVVAASEAEAKQRALAVVGEGRIGSVRWQEEGSETVSVTADTVEKS